MKLIYIVHQFYPKYITGTEQYVLSLAKEARRSGHTVTVITLEPDFLMGPPGLKVTQDDFDGFDVRRITLGNCIFANPVLAEFDSPLVLMELAHWLEEIQPDLVHVFHLKYLGARILDLVRAARIPLVLNLMDFWFLCPHVTLLAPDGRLCEGPQSEEAHCIQCGYKDLHRHIASARTVDEGSLPTYHDSLLRHTDGLGDLHLAAGLRSEFLRERFRRPDVVFAPSRFLKDKFIENGFKHHDFRIMPYGVEMSRLSHLVPTESRGLRVGYIGTIANHKGLHTLLDAFLGVISTEASLHIHGRLEDYPDYAKDRKHQAFADQRVRFRGGFAAEDLGRVLSNLDVLVVPSLWFENTPFVVLEALAAHVPVIASRLGGLTEAFVDGVSGLSFKAGDASELRSHLQGLVDDPKRMQSLKEAIPEPRTLEGNFREISSVYLEIQRMKESDKALEDESADLRAQNELLREEIRVKEQLNRDLYDQLMSLSARWIREQPDQPDKPAPK